MSKIAQVVFRERTAIKRNQLSRPVSLALRDGVLRREDSFFDYGCGRGEDIDFLRLMGFQAEGWDPSYRPDASCTCADVVNLGYVLNVVEDPKERESTLKRAYGLARGVLVVSAMIGYSAGSAPKAVPFSDGLLTSRGTFQKYFQQGELGEYVSSVLGSAAYAAGIGTFYLFRDEARESAYCTMLVQDTRGVLDDGRVRGMGSLGPDSLRRIAERVRATRSLPACDEVPEDSLALGILASSDDWIGSFAGYIEASELDAIRQCKREEFFVRFASSYFSPTGRLRLADLSRSDRADVRSVFGSINRAYRETEELFGQLIDPELVLRVSQEWGKGKVTPSALYLHCTLESQLPFELKLLVGCARSMVGDVLEEDTNLIKISHDPLSVSFAEYRDFDDDAHPCLFRMVRADFESGSVSLRAYGDSASPPILHRKELLVSADHPRLSEFRALSEQEGRLGLLGRRDIGSLQAWRRLLQATGVTIEGHSVRVGSPESVRDEQADSSVEGGNEEDPESLSDLCDEVTVKRVRVLKAARTSLRRQGAAWSEAVRGELAEVIYSLGRRPLDDEVRLPAKTVQRFLSLRNWQQVLGDRFDLGRYEEARKKRWSDWIVLLGSARFASGGRPQFRRLSSAEQADVKHLFGSYRQACVEADQWLFRIGNPDEVEREILSWPRGRHHETKGLYVHASLEEHLPLLVRLLLSCGRHLAKDALPVRTDVVRIAYNGANVKFYQYDDFDNSGPSRRVQGTKIDFRRRRVIDRLYEDPLRAPFLCQKHDLVDTSYHSYSQLLERTELEVAEMSSVKAPVSES